MAKLNYERDVKPLARHIDSLYDKSVAIRNVVDGWCLFIDNNQIYCGTLRECFCYLKGMEKVLKSKG